VFATLAGWRVIVGRWCSCSGGHLGVNLQSCKTLQVYDCLQCGSSDFLGKLPADSLHQLGGSQWRQRGNRELGDGVPVGENLTGSGDEFAENRHRADDTRLPPPRLEYASELQLVIVRP